MHFRLSCSHRELTKDHVLTSAYVKIFRTVTRNAVNRGVWGENRFFLTSLKQTCNEYLIKFSENQSAPKLENRKTSPCSPCAPNLLHVLVSQIPGYHNLCSPVVNIKIVEPTWQQFVFKPERQLSRHQRVDDGEDDEALSGDAKADSYQVPRVQT